MAEVSVLNAGGWGTALACLLARNGHDVTLWARRAEQAAALAATRENAAYLKGVELPTAVQPTSELAIALATPRVVIVAAVSRGLDALAAAVRPLLPAQATVLIATKGLAVETWQRPTEVLRETLGADFRGALAVLSGPTHAEEVARGMPTAAVVACADGEAARALQELVSAPHLRIYTSHDVVGVELCAAAKNVLAIAAGIGDGLGGGDNGKAALLTRGLAELGRFVVAHGGEPATVAGLAGMGDLIGTATSQHSRNRWAGEQLGRGRSLQEVLGATAMVVEGVPATRGVVALARASGVELPICEAVYRVLYEDQPPAEAMRELLTRPPAAEVSHRAQDC